MKRKLQFLACPTICRVIFVGAICLLGLSSADAAPPLSLEYVAERQIVTVGDEDVLFEAIVRADAEGLADGFVQLRFRDGSLIALMPIAAKPVFPRGTQLTASWCIVLLPSLDRPATPEDFVRVTVSMSQGDPAEDIWDYVGSNVIGDRVRFDVVGDLVFSKDRPQPLDYGQLAARVDLVAPKQIVKPFDGSAPFPFSADVVIERDQQARGYIEAPFSANSGKYNAWFATVLPHPKLGFQLVMVGVLDDPGLELTNDDLLTATLLPTGGDNGTDDCQIWDLVDGTTGEVQNAATFEAETPLKLSAGK